jgi:hypothetical protein
MLAVMHCLEVIRNKARNAELDEFSRILAIAATRACRAL